jgi:N-acetylglucosaminyldiphosphoundecaprenol N-acetyl-beta-D-mannosaminyltransferase
MRLATVNLLGCSIADLREPAYVCFATAHMVVEVTRKAAIRNAYQHATVIAPDGVPVAWFVRKLSGEHAECISGPRFMTYFLQHAQERGLRLGFYGGREETLSRIRARIEREFPSLDIAYLHSPPFRALSAEEQEHDLEQIRAAEVQVLFVGLGSPKQECWMSEHSAKLPCVCLGVGAAFEFFSGEKVLPPEWVQRLALTSLVRLLQEPRRLLVRNLYSPLFLLQGFRWVAMSDEQRNNWQQRVGDRLMHAAERVAEPAGP